MTLSMMADHDKLVVITCEEPNINHDKVKEDIRKIVQPRRHEAVVIEREVNHTIYQRIK